jgi:Alpha/beta hydrolase family
MKHLKLIICIGLILLPTLCMAADTDYGYPLPGSYGATILGTPPDLKPELPKKINSKRLVLDVIPGITKPDIFYYDEGLKCTFAYQDAKAPLIFLIAGTGSGDQAEKLMTLMKAFYQAGYHVVTLPSPTHPNFVISASHSHVPGDLTEDAADLYWVMEHVWKRVKADIEVSDFYLGGYSLGATQAAFVAKLDEERKSFNFRKVLMINPAVSLYDSVSRIEDTLNRIPGGPEHAGRFMNSLLNRFTEFYRQSEFVAFNENFLFALAKSGTISQDDAGGIIGVSFRIASAGMIFSSDVMTNGGYVVPKNRVLDTSDDLSDYFRLSTHLSFLDYFNEYFYPYFQKKRPGLTKEALIASLSIRSIEPYLKSSQKFGVMTNENDFILSNGDRDYLRQLFGERTKIYPRGGHLGNLEYKDNLAYAVDFFKQSGGK